MEQSEKDPTRMEMHISVNYAEGSKFQYPGEAEAASVYDTHEKTWRHMNFFQYRCYITARVPRVKLSNGKIKTVEVPWGRLGSVFTLMMEGVLLSLMKHMSVSSVTREVGEHDTKLWRVLDYHVTEALKDQNFSDVTGLSVDEYSYKGHKYITVFVSHPEIIIDETGKRKYIKEPRVLFVKEGKDKAAVERFVARFKEKKGIVNNVNVATSDMIHGFRNAVKELFPNAITTVDKFHIISNCETALDNVR